MGTDINTGGMLIHPLVNSFIARPRIAGGTGCKPTLEGLIATSARGTKPVQSVRHYGI